MKKTAWIDRANRVISFHPMEGREVYREEENDFWRYIVELCSVGYRVGG